MMTLNEFISKFEQDVVFVSEGTLTRDTLLSELEDWDSMATVATIALVDEHLGIHLNGEQLTSCQTLEDVIGLVKHKLEE